MSSAVRWGPAARQDARATLKTRLLATVVANTRKLRRSTPAASPPAAVLGGFRGLALFDRVSESAQLGRGLVQVGKTRRTANAPSYCVHAGARC